MRMTGKKLNQSCLIGKPMVGKQSSTTDEDDCNSYGISDRNDCHISTGKVEGINNKIHVLKRTAYGSEMNDILG